MGDVVPPPPILYARAPRTPVPHGVPAHCTVHAVSSSRVFSAAGSDVLLRGRDVPCLVVLGAPALGAKALDDAVRQLISRTGPVVAYNPAVALPLVIDGVERDGFVCAVITAHSDGDRQLLAAALRDAWQFNHRRFFVSCDGTVADTPLLDEILGGLGALAEVWARKPKRRRDDDALLAMPKPQPVASADAPKSANHANAAAAVPTATSAAQHILVLAAASWCELLDAFHSTRDAAELVPWCVACSPMGPPIAGAGATGVVVGALCASPEHLDCVEHWRPDPTRWARPSTTYVVPRSGRVQAQWRLAWLPLEPELRCLCSSHAPTPATIGARTEAFVLMVDAKPAVVKADMALPPCNTVLLIVLAQHEPALYDAPAAALQSMARWQAAYNRFGPAAVVVVAPPAEYYDMQKRLADAPYTSDVATPVFVVAGEGDAADMDHLLAYLHARHRAKLNWCSVVAPVACVAALVASNTGCRVLPSLQKAVEVAEEAKSRGGRHVRLCFLDAIRDRKSAAAAATDPLVAALEASGSWPRITDDTRVLWAPRHGVVLASNTPRPAAHASTSPGLLVASNGADGADGAEVRPLKALDNARGWLANVLSAHLSQDDLATGKRLAEQATQCADPNVAFEPSADGAQLAVRGKLRLPSGRELAYAQLRVACEAGTVLDAQCECTAGAPSTRFCRHIVALWFLARADSSSGKV